MRGYSLVICGALTACVSTPDQLRSITLSQTNSVSITSGVGCQASSTSYIRDNSFYRGFRLADYGVHSTFHVGMVTFGVASAISNSAALTQPVELSIYAYTGALGRDTIDLSKLTKRGATTADVGDTTTPVPIEVALVTDLIHSDTALVVELHAADGNADMHRLSFGVNQEGETAPAYQRAPDCGQASPVSLPAAGFGSYALVLSVSGQG